MRPQKLWVKVVGWIFAVRIALGLVGLVVVVTLMWAWLIFKPMEERYWDCMQSSVEEAAKRPDAFPEFFFTTENRQCQGDRPEGLSTDQAFEQWQQRVLEARS